MRQVWIPRIGGPEVLEVREAPDPEPAVGEVRIAVEAAGINFADLQARVGLYPDAPPLPAVVGYEVSGTVDKLGDGVDPTLLGAPVVAMCRFGGYASMRCVPATQVARRPPGIDAIVGAAIPVVTMTAWMLLEIMGRVRKGDRVLVHSAGGGVGLAALDLCLRHGVAPVGIASEGKHAFLRERGYAELHDPRSDWEAALAKGPAFDLILDPVGGESWARGLRLLAAGGRLACYGFSANATGEQRNLLAVARNMWAVPWRKLLPIALINDNKGVLGVNMGHLWHEADRLAQWLRDILVLTEEGQIRPIVHAAIPFDRAAEAHQLIHDRKNIGKVVLVP